MSVFSALGAGNMANAILSGAVASGYLEPSAVGTYNIHEEKRSAMAAKGYTVYPSIEDLCRNSKYILLSMKPQQAEEVLRKMAPVFSPDSVVISIAAGISQSFIKSILGEGTKVVLAMPNTPLLVGCGATAVARCEPTTGEEFNFVKGVFSSAGLVEEIPEDKMNEIIARQPGLGREFAIGPSYFKGYDGNNLEEIWNRNIRPILREYMRGRKDPEGFEERCKAVLLPGNRT